MKTCELEPLDHHFRFAASFAVLKALGKFLIIPSVALAGQAFGGLRDAPLPDDLFVTEPGPGVPDAMRPFAGKWSGDAFLASVHLPHVLVIERLHHNLAWAVWSMGLSVYAGGPSAWYRIPMRVQDGQLTTYPPGGSMTYRLASNDELEFEGTRAGYRVKGTLKREPMPTQPYTNVEPRTYWPAGIESMQPGTSTSPNAAVFPELLTIEPASPTLPAERAKWLGKWSGWACSSRSCDIKLAVLQATPDTARVIHLFASKDYKPDGTVRDAVFVDDELRIRFGGGYRMTYRMRPNGVIEAFYVDRTGRMSRGVMTKEP
jgi:hypothetical protein